MNYERQLNLPTANTFGHQFLVRYLEMSDIQRWLRYEMHKRANV